MVLHIYTLEQVLNDRRDHHNWALLDTNVIFACFFNDCTEMQTRIKKYVENYKDFHLSYSKKRWWKFVITDINIVEAKLSKNINKKHGIDKWLEEVKKSETAELTEILTGCTNKDDIYDFVKRYRVNIHPVLTKKSSGDKALFAINYLLESHLITEDKGDLVKPCLRFWHPDNKYYTIMRVAELFANTNTAYKR